MIVWDRYQPIISKVSGVLSVGCINSVQHLLLVVDQAHFGIGSVMRDVDLHAKELDQTIGSIWKSVTS